MKSSCLCCVFLCNDSISVTSSVRSILPCIGSHQFPWQPHPRLQKVSQSAHHLCVCVCPPSFHIPHFSTFCLLTPDWRLKEACSIIGGHCSICCECDMCILSHHLQCLCMGSCREKTLHHTCTHAYARTMPHAYGGHHPSALAPKAPWEICKLADAHHCPIYPNKPPD